MSEPKKDPRRYKRTSMPCQVCGAPTKRITKGRRVCIGKGFSPHPSTTHEHFQRRGRWLHKLSF